MSHVSLESLGILSGHRILCSNFQSVTWNIQLLKDKKNIEYQGSDRDDIQLLTVTIERIKIVLSVPKIRWKSAKICKKLHSSSLLWNPLIIKISRKYTKVNMQWFPFTSETTKVYFLLFISTFDMYDMYNSTHIHSSDLDIAALPVDKIISFFTTY